MATDNTSAVRLFVLEHPQIARTLRGKLEVQRRDLATQIAEGYAADWGDYRQRTGVIQGLKLAIEQCIQIEKDQTGDS